MARTVVCAAAAGSFSQGSGGPPASRSISRIETAKAHFRAKVEHPLRIIKCQFGFRKVFYRGIRKNDLKLKLLLALANLWMVRVRIPDPD
jgi:IS5 family transposase